MHLAAPGDHRARFLFGINREEAIVALLPDEIERDVRPFMSDHGNIVDRAAINGQAVTGGM
jgi:hypothetical protein